MGYFYDGLGEKVNVYGDDEMRIKRIHLNPIMNLDEQWCPNCNKKCKWDSVADIFVCQSCNYAADKEMIENGEGYGSYEDSLRFDGL